MKIIKQALTLTLALVVCTGILPTAGAQESLVVTPESYLSEFYEDAASPTVTQEGDTVTITGASGLEIILPDVVSYEDVYVLPTTVRVYHLACDGADVKLSNVSYDNSDSNHLVMFGYHLLQPVRNEAGGWDYERVSQWQELECPVGSYRTQKVLGIDSDPESRERTSFNLGTLQIGAVGMAVEWGDIMAYFVRDEGKLSLTNDTIYGISLDEYLNTTAFASTQTVTIDGKAVELAAYALKDANGNDTNYIKVRDIASLLNGTAAQFEVGWDGSVNLLTGQSYTSTGLEMSTPFEGNRAYTTSTAATKVDGSAVDLDAITLKDREGGGYTYYQLRDLGRALGFNVGWSAESGIFLETDKPYSDAN